MWSPSRNFKLLLRHRPGYALIKIIAQISQRPRQPLAAEHRRLTSCSQA